MSAATFDQRMAADAQGTLAPAAPRGFSAERFGSFSALREEWARFAAAGAATPFQHTRWLDAWYSAMADRAGMKPFFLALRDAATGELALALPLVEFAERGLTVITFADCGVTDYNAPLLGPAAPSNAEDARAAWDAICAALQGADLIRFEKMLVKLFERDNPLACVPGVRGSSLNGNLLEVSLTWPEWRKSLGRAFRKEIERSWRVFLARPSTSFRRITGRQEGAKVLAAIEQMQRERIGELGYAYILDEAHNAAIYRDLVERGLEDGSVVLTALFSGDEAVAALLGLCDGRSYAMVRLAAAGGEWKNCSPGRLIIEGSMGLMRAAGITRFDFTIGDYPFKRRLGAANVELADLTKALSWRALPRVAAGNLRRAARNNSTLRSAFRKIKSVLTRNSAAGAGQ